MFSQVALNPEKKKVKPIQSLFTLSKPTILAIHYDYYIRFQVRRRKQVDS